MKLMTKSGHGKQVSPILYKTTFLTFACRRFRARFNGLVIGTFTIRLVECIGSIGAIIPIAFTIMKIVLEYMEDVLEVNSE